MAVDQPVSTEVLNGIKNSYGGIRLRSVEDPLPGTDVGLVKVVSTVRQFSPLNRQFPLHVSQ